MKLVILGAALIVTLCVVALLYRRRLLNLVRNRVGKYRVVLDNTVIFDDNGKPGLSPLELLKLSQIDKDSFVMGEGLLALTTWSENQGILFQSSAWQSDKHKVLKLSIENGKHEYIQRIAGCVFIKRKEAVLISNGFSHLVDSLRFQFLFFRRRLLGRQMETDLLLLIGKDLG